MTSATKSELPTCGEWLVDDVTYHADRTAESWSTITTAQDSLRKYYNQYVEGQKREETDALIVGRALHALIFEPDIFDKQFVCMPTEYEGEKIDRRKSNHKKFLAEWGKEHEGFCHLRAEDWDNVQVYADLAREHGKFGEFLTDSRSRFEHSTRFPFSDMQCKNRFDLLCSANHVNVKTSRYYRPDDISRDIYNFNYDGNMGFYQLGHREVYNEDCANWLLWIFKGDPKQCIEPFALMLRLGLATMDVGRQKARAYSKKLSMAKQMDWFYDSDTVDLEIPFWGMRQWNVSPLDYETEDY